MIKIGTHNGVFHTDEIIAIAMVKTVSNENIEIIRTRENNTLIECNIRVDVGGRHDPNYQSIYNEKSNFKTTFIGYSLIGDFDHHQFKEGDEFYGRSSAGLILLALTEPIEIPSNPDNPWENTILGQPSQSLINLVSAVDANDTRVDRVDYERWQNEKFCQDTTYDDLFKTIASCNQLDIGSPEQDAIFSTLVDLFVEYFNDKLNKEELYDAINDIAERTQKNSKKEVDKIKDTIIVNDKFIYFKDFKAFPMAAKWLWEQGHSNKIFISFDKLQNNWTYQVDTNVREIINISNKIFVHSNGFIAKSTDGIDKVKLIISN